VADKRLFTKDSGGSVVEVGTNPGGAVTFTAGSASAPAISTTGDTNTGIFFPAADTIAFAEGGAEAMRLDSSGNLGLGTASPAYKLDVRTSGAALQIFSTDGTVTQAVGYCSSNIAFSGSLSNHAYGFLTNNTERMRIDTSGRLGLGTTSPSQKLELRTDTTTNGSESNILISNRVFGTTPYYVGGIFGNGYRDTSDPTYIAGIDFYRGSSFDGYASSGSIIFYTDGAGQNSLPNLRSNSERMRIDGSGNLLVGQTASVGVGKLQIGGTMGAHGYATRPGTSGPYGANTFNINWTGSPQLWIDTTNVGTIQLASDYRIKRNIETQTAPALERVMALRPVTYKMADYGDLFKSSDDIKEGFIAHEVQEVIPSGAEGVKDEENRIQSLRVDAILAVAVKAIQELKAEVDSLKAQLENK
jgi:hypothetical protein